MDWNLNTFYTIAAFTISVSASGPIIELPEDYNEASPWKQLADLGLTKLTETDCQRTCIVGDPPRVCLYTLHLEFYSAMGTACKNCSNGVIKDCFASQCIPTDGQERGVTSVNRMIPGPQINVCKNDVLVVNVINQMDGTGATVHWHGIFQKGSQWMDGVPYVTQCPINSGESFRYIFTVKQSGTYFYHSHTGLQRANGQYGALVSREPRMEEPWSSDIYDLDLPEHTMVISDWMHQPAEMFLPGLPTKKPGVVPVSILLNGMGRFLNGSEEDKYFNVRHPLATFHVEKNKRYRWRIINANSLTCPVVFQIENHKMTLIATDGNPIKPVLLDAVISSAGERFDVIIDTNNNLKANSFWIHLRGLEVCESREKVQQYGVLSYGTNSSHLDIIIPKTPRPTLGKPFANETVVNPENPKCGISPKSLCMSDLRSMGKEVERERDILTVKPDVRIFIPFGFRHYDVDKFHQLGNYRKYMNLEKDIIRTGIMNNITFKFPSTPILFSRNTTNPGFCTPDNLPDDCSSNDKNSVSRCDCPHVMTIKKNHLVEMILVNAEIAPESVDHSMHLHGHSFHTVHIGQDQNRTTPWTNNEIQEILRRLPTKDKSSKPSNIVPALKDSIIVPVKGYAVVRWRADNSGDWLMHCHFEWHGIVGMMMVFRVEGEISEKPPGFPTCGNFDPLKQL